MIPLCLYICQDSSIICRSIWKAWCRVAWNNMHANILMEMTSVQWRSNFVESTLAIMTTDCLFKISHYITQTSTPAKSTKFSTIVNETKFNTSWKRLLQHAGLQEWVTTLGHKVLTWYLVLSEGRYNLNSYLPLLKPALVFAVVMPWCTERHRQSLLLLSSPAVSRCKWRSLCGQHHHCTTTETTAVSSCKTLY